MLRARVPNELNSTIMDTAGMRAQEFTLQTDSILPHTLEVKAMSATYNLDAPAAVGIVLQLLRLVAERVPLTRNDSVTIRVMLARLPNTLPAVKRFSFSSTDSQDEVFLLDSDEELTTMRIARGGPSRRSEIEALSKTIVGRLCQRYVRDLIDDIGIRLRILPDVDLAPLVFVQRDDFNNGIVRGRLLRLPLYTRPNKEGSEPVAQPVNPQDIDLPSELVPRRRRAIPPTPPVADAVEIAEPAPAAPEEERALVYWFTLRTDVGPEYVVRTQSQIRRVTDATATTLLLDLLYELLADVEDATAVDVVSVSLFLSPSPQSVFRMESDGDVVLHYWDGLARNLRFMTTDSDYPFLQQKMGGFFLRCLRDLLSPQGLSVVTEPAVATIVSPLRATLFKTVGGERGPLPGPYGVKVSPLSVRVPSLVDERFPPVAPVRDLTFHGTRAPQDRPEGRRVRRRLR